MKFFEMFDPPTAVKEILKFPHGDVYLVNNFPVFIPTPPEEVKKEPARWRTRE